jgi:hypothetical protein
MAVTTALALVFVSLAGIRSVLDHTGTFVPAIEPPGHRTATVWNVSITYSDDWYLTTPGSKPAEFRSSLQLSNFDPGAQPDVCAPDGVGMPANGVVLTVEQDPDARGAPAWPVKLQPSHTPSSCKGENLAASWEARYSGTFRASAVIGPEVNSGDRDEVLAAYSSLEFPIDYVGLDGTFVVASGTLGDRSWTMYADPGDRSQPGIDLHVDTTDEGGGLSGSGIGGVVAERPSDVTISTPIMHGNELMFGGVSRDVARVEVRPDGADAFDATLFELPSSLDAAFRAFAAPMLGAPRGRVIAFDAAGNRVAEVPFTPDGYCSQRQPCAGQVRAGPIAEGRALGRPWTIDLVADRVQLVDGEGNVLASVQVSTDPIRATTYTFSGDQGMDSTKQYYLPFGVVSADATQVVYFSSGLPSVAELAPLSEQDGGLQVFWSPEVGTRLGGGSVSAFNASCRFIAGVDLSTGRALESPPSTSCAG